MDIEIRYINALGLVAGICWIGAVFAHNAARAHVDEHKISHLSGELRKQRKFWVTRGVVLPQGVGYVKTRNVLFLIGSTLLVVALVLQKYKQSQERLQVVHQGQYTSAKYYRQG